MSGSILLSKKHGVNPTIPVCPYCGKPKNEIILTGYAGEKWAKKNGHSDGQMPMYVIMQGDLEPCDECKKNGITIIEAEADVEGEISVTGKSWLLKEEAFLRIFDTNNAVIKNALSKRVCFMDPTTTERIGLR